MRLRTHALLLATTAGFASFNRFRAPEGEEEGGGSSGVSTSSQAGVDRVTIQSAPDVDAARTAAASLGKPAPKEGEEGAEGGTPAGLPEGFATVEDFVKAVNSGEYKPGSPAKAEGEAGDVDENGNAKLPQAPLPDDPRLQPFTEEFTTSGTLTEESMGKAAKEFLGDDNPMTRAMVQTYLAGLQESGAKVEVAAAPFHEAAGGREQFAEFQAWTAQDGSLTKAEQSAYDALLAQGKQAEALAVLQPIISRWKAAGNGPAPRDITGKGGGQGGSQGGDTYESWAQLTADQAKSEYRDDPAFRAKVEAKLGRSKL